MPQLGDNVCYDRNAQEAKKGNHVCQPHHFLIQQIYEEVVLISSINISVRRTVLCVAESGF